MTNTEILYLALRCDIRLDLVSSFLEARRESLECADAPATLPGPSTMRVVEFVQVAA